MRPNLLNIWFFLFLIYCVNARKSGGGSRSHGSSHTSSHRTPSHTSSHYSPPSSSSHSGRTSSSNFLHAESGRPSLPASHYSAPSYRPPSRPTVTHTPSAPSYHPPSAPSYHPPSAPSYHPSNTHTFNSGRAGVVNEQHRQSSAPVSHNSAYDRQPAYNPHVSTGFGNHGTAAGTSYSSPPYPVNQPNHPHPSNIGTSSFPSGYKPVTNGAAYHPPTNTGGAYHPTSGVGFHHPTYHPHNTTSYQPSHAGVYHPPAYQPNNAAVYQPQTYHPNNAAVYQPATYQPNNAAVYHPPTYAGGYHPTVGQAPQHTVYVIPDSRRSSSPGIGTHIASGIAGGVAAGATNAIVDHAISSIFRPNYHGVHTYPSAPAPGTPTTSITNNYYYNNGAPAPNQPDQTNSFNGQPNSFNGQPNSFNGQPNSFNGQPGQTTSSQNQPPVSTNNQGTVYNPNTNNNNMNNGHQAHPNGVVSRTPELPEVVHPDESNSISDEELMQLSEELFNNLNTNINQYVELNLQKRVDIVENRPLVDEASEPLFIVKPGLDSLPTVSKLKALYGNYQRNGTLKEVVTPDKQIKENAFLDEITKTPIMKIALNWLSAKHYVKANENEQRELLKNTWFTIFGNTTSSFERIFMSETLGDNGIVGMQNWIYVAHLEQEKIVDYLGYVDMLSLSGRGALLKINLKSDNIPLQGLPMLIGTPPELEMALYTVCMHARFGGYCPISLGGAKFFIFTQDFKENNKYLIDVGFPLI